MAINVSQAFHRTSANPVDESMALTKAQMKTVNDNLMPAYYFTICQDDGGIYLYDKSATASAETGKFKKFEGGGGSGGGSTLVINKTLTAAGWSNKQQSLTFTGYDSDLGGVIGMPTNATAAQKEAYKKAEINVTAQNGAVFTFSCKDVPEIDLPVTLYAGGGSGSGGGGTADFPAGGTTGQALVKASNADNDVEWGTINSIPDGGTEGQVLAKHSATDKDVEWVDQIDTQKEIKNNGTAVTDRDTINFTDFDISDDSTNEETDIKPHKITPGEWSEIMSTLPGAPVQKKIYSPVEQEIGEWREMVDGVLKQKPVYQRTVVIDNPATDWTTLNDYGLGFIPDEIIDVKRRYNMNNTWYASSEYEANTSANGYLRVLYNNRGFRIYAIENVVSVRLILQYTKTTDQWETV